MAQFDFITREDFRASLASDYSELHDCLAASCWKAVHVLAGSIIEAVLIDFLITTNPQDEQKLLLYDLNRAVEECRTLGVLTQKSRDLTSVVRAYRNLIHPGRVARLGESISNKSAMIATTLVDMVIDEVCSKVRDRYGYTAEQILGKLVRDHSSLPVVRHLLKDLRERELEQLVLSVVPEHYFNEATREDEYTTPDRALLRLLSDAHRTAFDIAPVSVREKAVAKFVRILKEDGGYEVVTYEGAFFRASDLQYAADADLVIIKSHLLSRMSEELDEELLSVVQGLTKFLSNDEVYVFADSLLKFAANKPHHKLISLMRNFTSRESAAMPDIAVIAFNARVDAWVKFLTSRNQAEAAEVVGAFSVLRLEDIPF